MRGTGACAMLARVDRPALVRVTLEVERDSDPPRGRLLRDDAVHPFAGWLGLAVALERALDLTADRPNTSRAPTDG
jgi:hypothetical protein